jgi:hypothetical protein
MWGIDYDTLVNAVRYKHAMIHAQLDKPVEAVGFWCANPGCYKVNKHIDLAQAVSDNYARSIHGANTMSEQASRQLTLLNTGTRGVAAAHATKRPRTGSNRQLATVPSSSVKTEVKLEAPAPAASSPAATAAGAKEKAVQSSFHCRGCDEFLYEVSADSTHDLADLKRRFNEQTRQISEQMEMVAVLLTRRAELRAANVETETKESGAVSGVGAKGGFSSATDLASVRDLLLIRTFSMISCYWTLTHHIVFPLQREEKKKNALAWDTVTEAETRLREDEERRRLQRHQEAEAARKREEEARAREEHQTQLAKEARDREDENRIKASVFGRTMEEQIALSAAITAQEAPVEMVYDVKHELHEEPMYEEEVEQAAEIANADAIVTVQGEEMRVGDVTQEDVDRMTDEEVMAYEELTML